ncbi:hypothetical protein jhhlp_006405 [Lomentospora prolificans]|uniref:25S rRNA (Uridine(2843)-N(3))-methyltransferase n=1 Tax=Lomentospora prolificans TaxID=41688 RepID=A0A2N3N5V6_9PEZI|nr:hypothetical protein jhhlp_006405 [Lomentospora prolificans]
MAKKPQSSRGTASKGSSKASSRAPGKGDPARPGTSKEPVPSPPLLELKTQQLLLDLFSRVFADELSAHNFETTLQAIKGALFNRDFAAAFSKEEHLAAYAARWSPTRALCYASIFESISDHLTSLADATQQVNEVEKSEPEPVARLRMLSVGGGAAEVAAFSTLLMGSGIPKGEAVLVDSGPWGSVVKRLHDTLTTYTARQISKYTYHGDDVDNGPVVAPESLLMDFSHGDILAATKEQLSKLLGTQPLLITILFTLNELYTSGGIGKTTTFLLNLTSCAPVGSLLLVVDSPGSYSETGVGTQAKKYPMQWLLHHTLTKSLEDTWERLETSDSAWFRLADSLRYPISLENMRYQLHLYRLVRSPT